MRTMSATSRSDRRPRRGFDSLEQEAFLNLWRTYDRLRRFEDELFSQHELTPQQYNALRVLRGEHPASLPTLALAARLVSHAPDITRLLDKLVERGLIRRQRPVDNRRQVQVSITSEGLALLKKLDKLVRKCHEEQLGHLSADDLRRLVGLLEAARRPHETQSSVWNPRE
jgi:DNA-binding MarR family transcriptional regulator